MADDDGMDRQALRRWVLRFNADGPQGLLDRWSSGPLRRLSDEQLHAFCDH